MELYSFSLGKGVVLEGSDIVNKSFELRIGYHIRIKEMIPSHVLRHYLFLQKIVTMIGSKQKTVFRLFCIIKIQTVEIKLKPISSED